MPSGINAGGGGTALPADVVTAWAVDCLKAAGYAAAAGAQAGAPTLTIKLSNLWGDGMPVGMTTRHTFNIVAELSVTPADGSAATWSNVINATGGATTVFMRFTDPFEAGFVRAFDEATRSLLGFAQTPEFQAALPGGDPAAAANAIANLGKEPEKEEKGKK
jgi:hypothetical protein